MGPMTDPAPAVPVRPAATLILVRDSSEGLEVLMVRRHPGSVFQADAWVFPGGAVDPSDAGVAVHGLTDAEASTALGLPSGGLSFFVAAARECFEEAGLLLARRTDPGPFTDLDAVRFARHRRALLAGRRTLTEVLDAESLVLDLSGLHYLSRWVTPPGPPRRFDTRFFVAAAPAGQTASHDTAETVASVWTTPARALEEGSRGEIRIVLPTVRHLEALAHHADTASLLAAAPSLDLAPPGAPELPCPI